MSLNQDEYENYLMENKIQRQKQTPLVLAILGLMFAPFFGLGGILSVISFILALGKKCRNSSAKTWALYLSVGGIVFAVITVVMTVIFSGSLFVAPDLSPYLT